MAPRQKFALSEIIREARQRKYKTAKDFWSENEAALGASYTHYSAIETGTKLPDIELTISIAKILKIDLRLVCHVWARDQMPDPETRAFFEPIPGREVMGMPSTIHMNLDDFYVFTEKHIPMFEKFPQAWSVISFIVAFSETVSPTKAQLASLFKMSESEIGEIVDWALGEGLIVVESDGQLKTKRKFIHLPNTEEFKRIRDRNFTTVSQEVVGKITPAELRDKEAARTTFMRRITRLQAQEIARHIDDVVGHFGNLPNVGQEFYALAISFGPRFKFDGGDAG